ncbi:MAG TPA: hypothetical protein VGR15_05085, partial [Bacteroidota bacterium]|nr:hypothetical protein [Bacteroidota bacterium]
MSERINDTGLSRFLAVSMLVLCWYPCARAQQEKVIELDHADSLMGLVIDGEAARRLVGNVKFHQGKIVVSCREAIHYKERNKIVA